MVAEDVQSGDTEGLSLGRQMMVNGRLHIEVIRPLAVDEEARIAEARRVVSAIARSTPYHAFIAARDRFWGAYGQLVSPSTESENARLRRACSAASELCSEIAGHGDAWLELVGSCGGAVGGAREVLAHWGDQPCVVFAGVLEAASSLTLAVAGDGGPIVSVDGESIAVAGWLNDIEVQTVLIADTMLGLMEDVFAESARVILGVASEVLSGQPILLHAPLVGGGGAADAQLPKLDLGAIDAAAVAAADTFMVSARSMASDIRNGPAPAESWAIPTPVADSHPDQVHPEEEHPALPELFFDLREVADAIAKNVEGLASRWARSFDAAEFLACVENEKELAASLVRPIQRALQKTDEPGGGKVLPTFPVAASDLPGWIDDNGDSVAAVSVLTVLGDYLQSLQDVTQARRVDLRDEIVDIEFDPFRTTTAHRQARLLAELTREDDEEDEQRLRTAIYLCSRLGLPEAQLLYSLRLLGRRGTPHQDAMASAVELVEAFASGRVSELARHVIIAGALTRELDAQAMPDA